MTDTSTGSEAHIQVRVENTKRTEVKVSGVNPDAVFATAEAARSAAIHMAKQRQ